VAAFELIGEVLATLGSRQPTTPAHADRFTWLVRDCGG